MIRGSVDDYGRPLVPVRVFHPDSENNVNLEAWIDTGFTGGLLLTRDQVTSLGLALTSTVAGSLADGSKTLFETFTCVVDWFGQRRRIEAIAGTGKFALVGLRLFEDCTVFIDYPGRKITLESQPSRNGTSAND